MFDTDEIIQLRMWAFQQVVDNKLYIYELNYEPEPAAERLVQWVLNGAEKTP